jgi:dolichol kinase
VIEPILRDDGAGALLVAVYVLALFAGAEISRRIWGLHVETTRKATHLGAGAIVMAFPWILHHTVTVVLLALAFGGILVAGRVTGVLGSIHAVERRTSGAYLYPFAVLAIWVLSGGDALEFCVPLAVMAVADAGAAIVGQRAGETTYPVMDGRRSVEGSMAFFSLAFAVVLMGCTLAHRPGWPDLLLVTLVVASLTTAVEAVSVRGSDNLAIPYAAWLALDHTDRLGLDKLGDWILGMSLGLLVLAATSVRASLTAAGAVVIFLVATIAWAIGGPAWFAPIGALYALYLLARPEGTDTELDMVFPSTAGSMVVVLAHAHTGDERLFGPYVVTVAANGAMAFAAIAGVRGWPVVASAALGAALPVAVARIVAPETPWAMALALAIPAVLLFRALTPTGFAGRRIAASVLVGAASWWWGG